MNKKWLATTGIGVLAVLVGAAWGLGWFDRDDPALAELEQLRDEGFSQQEEMSEAERETERDAFRDRMEGLSEEQRRAFFESSMPMMMKMFEQRMDKFFALSPDEQQAEMDQQLDQFEKFSNQRGGQQGGGQQGGGPFGGGNQPDPEQFDAMRKKGLEWTSPAQRAKMETYMKMFSERAKERGLSPGPGGGFF